MFKHKAVAGEMTDMTAGTAPADILTAAAPGETGDRAAQSVWDLVVHPQLEVLAAASRARRPSRLPGAVGPESALCSET